MKNQSRQFLLKSIVIHEKQNQRKEFKDSEVFVTIESGSIYVLNGKWRIKGKKVSNVLLQETRVVITAEESEFIFERLTTRDEDEDQWKVFCNLCAKLRKKQNHSTIPSQYSQPETISRNSNTRTTSTHGRRIRGVFGHAGKSRNVKLNAMPWDECSFEDNLNLKMPSTTSRDANEEFSEAEATQRASPHLEKEISKTNVESLVGTVQEHDSIAARVSEASTVDDDDNKTGRRKFYKLSSANGRSNESDTDDDGIFNENTDNIGMTTPIAKRIVSPVGTSSTERAASTSISSAMHVGAKSAKIDSFFRPRKSTNAETRAQSTCSPVRQVNASQTLSPGFSHSDTYHNSAIAAATESAKRRKNLLQEDHDWLHRSPALVASTNSHRKETLFGKNLSLSPMQENITSGLSISNAMVDGTSITDLEPRTNRLKRPRLKVKQSTNKSDAVDPTAQKLPLHTDLSSIPMPVATGVDIQFRGLRNLGNTCYLNASLQMLFSSTDLVRSLRRYHGLLTNSILWVADELHDNNEKWNSVNPSIIKEAMDKMTNKFFGYEQADAHEFLNDMIDHLHEEHEAEERQNNEVDTQRSSSKTCGFAMPMNDFSLTARVSLKCTSCGYSRSKEEMYRNLSIDIVTAEPGDAIEQKASVNAGLAHFFQPETRELKCEKCQDGTHASQTLEIITRPKLLLLHLKRFIVVEPHSSETYGDENQSPNRAPKTLIPEYILKKNTDPVVIPDNLSLGPFERCSPRESSKSQMESPSYKLVSVVHHIGSIASSGHYTADAIRQLPKNVDDSETMAQNSWVSFDDGRASLTSLDDVIGSDIKQETAYMLLYSLDQRECPS